MKTNESESLFENKLEYFDPMVYYARLGISREHDFHRLLILFLKDIL